MVRAIAEGSLKPGKSLAVRQVAGQFGINSATVGKGYALLRQERLVRTSRRSGSVVSRGPGDPPTPGFSAGWSDRLRILLAEAVARGMPEQSIRDTADWLLTEFAARRADAERSSS